MAMTMKVSTQDVMRQIYGAALAGFIIEMVFTSYYSIRERAIERERERKKAGVLVLLSAYHASILTHTPIYLFITLLSLFCLPSRFRPQNASISPFAREYDKRTRTAVSIWSWQKNAASSHSSASWETASVGHCGMRSMELEFGGKFD